MMAPPPSSSSTSPLVSSSPRFLLPLTTTSRVTILLACISALPYLPSLNGAFCYDDKVAVAGNPDVCLHGITLWDIFTHDFWGNDILRTRRDVGGWTHDSWRPLVTLSFRANHRLMSGLNTWSYHVTNVLINAICTMVVYHLYRRIIVCTTMTRRTSKTSPATLPALSPAVFASSSSSFTVGYRAEIAALLFALNPIHSECVANITSRADPLASIAMLIALLVYISHMITTTPATTVTTTTTTTATTAATTTTVTTTCSQLGSRLYSYIHSLHLLSWFHAMLWVLVALMCKETALTAPVVLAVIECILHVPQALVNSSASVVLSPSSSSSSAAAAYPSSRSRWLWTGSSSSSGRMMMMMKKMQQFILSFPISRSILSFIFAAGLYYIRISVFSRGYSLQNFANEMHNPLATLVDPFERWMAKAYVQSWSLSAMVFPFYLSHEHAASRPVVEIGDFRNTLTICVFGTLSVVTGWALWVILQELGMGASSDQNGESGSDNRLLVTPPTVFPSNNEEEINLDAFHGENSEHAQAAVEKEINTNISSVASSSGNTHSRNATKNDQNPLISKQMSSLPASVSTMAPILLAAADFAGEKTAAEKIHLKVSSSSSSIALRCLVGIAWTLITYAPASHAFLYVAFVVAERTLYLPSIGISILVAEFFAFMLGDGDDDHGNCSHKDKDNVPFESNSHHTISSSQQITQDKKQKKMTPAVMLATTNIAPYSSESSSSPSSSSPSLHSKTNNTTTTSRRVAMFALFLLSAYYAFYSGKRNLDWLNEETLLSSNIALYPTNNGMSMYGLGAVKMYKGEIEEAEEYLQIAANQTTLAEPTIMLGQMYWRYKKDYATAIKYLEKLEHTSTPRKEILQNLGLLLMLTGAAPEEDPVARQRAEYLVLAGHKAHGYPMGHPNIGCLASNAACIRMLSEPYRYGDFGMAEDLFVESLHYRHVARPSTTKNAAYFYAVTGRPERAFQVLDEGIAFIEGLLLLPDLPDSSIAEAQSYIRLFNVTRLSILTHMPYIVKWGKNTTTLDQEDEVVGSDESFFTSFVPSSLSDFEDLGGSHEDISMHAPWPFSKSITEKRLALLGGECSMDLVYW